MTLYKNPHQEPLAIVGMACKYAGSIDSPSDLHEQVLAARSMQGSMPSSRMDTSFYYHPDAEATGSTYTKGGYFLDKDVNVFDAPFFQLSELDVLAMDPQQKMLLENVYHALENAGIPLKEAVSSVASVFVGCSNNDHLALTNADLLMSLKGKGTGTSPSILANRISWFYDFRGTSQTIDTACSSSLVAFHQACMDVRTGRSPMSIVSGVNLIEHPAATLYLSNLGVLSPDGRSWSFDARANGYGRGEGLGTVIIKPLYAALRDGNRVRAVIRASGSNQDGRTPGITVPSVAAQAQLIRNVYKSADLDPSQTGYVEAHGTGTQVGDPLEVQAIVSALADQIRDTPLYVGSVKSVVGHLEGGAGLAGLISATLAVESKTVPPVAGLKTLNPRIVQRDDLKFARQATPWPRDDVRRASINSFGFGGTNAHVVLDDVEGFLNEFLGSHLTGTLQVIGPSSTTTSRQVHVHAINGIKPVSNGHVNGVNGVNGVAHSSWIPENRVFILSAFDEAGLDRNAASMISHLGSLNFQGDSDMEEGYMNDLCHTINEKRTRFDWRSYHVADTVENLQKSLQNVRPLRRSAAPKTIRFVFTGQGANWAGMAQDLMVYPLFQRRIHEAALFLRNIGCQWDLYDRITSQHGDLNEPIFAQSSCVAVQIALVDLLHSWKTTPSTVVGHSSGEIAAAYCAGKISRQTAWKVAYCRGQVCAKQTHEDGCMLAAAMPAEELERLVARVNKGLSSAVQIGCYNSPKNLTLTGTHEGILRVKGELDDAGVLNRLLPVKVAYHSVFMREVAPDYLELLGDLDFGEKINQEAGVTIISSVTGRPALAGEVEDPSYWVDNLVSPVRFSTALLTSMRNPNTSGSQEDALIEIGPHSTLRSAINETLADHPELQPFHYGSLLKRYETDGTTILHTFGMLACYGHEINCVALNDRRSGTKKVAKILNDLPPYEFDHSRSVRGRTRRIEHIKFPAYKRHELLGMPVEDTNTFEQRWRNILRPDDITWLRMNRMKGNIHFPGVAYLLMAMEAAVQRAGESESITGVRLGNVSMLAPLPVSDTPEGVEIISSIYPMNASANDRDDWCTFRIISHDAADNAWIEHCVGSVRIETSEQKASPCPVKKESLLTCDKSVDIDQMYQRFGAAGMDFGKFLRNIQDMKLSADHKACTATIATPDIPKTAHDRYIIHPCTFESILHVLLCLCEATSSPMVTNYIEEVFISYPSHQAVPKFQALAATNRTSSTTWKSGVLITAEDGKQEISIKGLDLVQLPPSDTESSEAESFYVVKWKPDVHLVTSVQALRDAAPVEVHQRLPNFDDHEGFQLASAVFLLDTMDYVEREGLPSLPDHHKAFMDWMQRECELIAESSAPYVDRALLEGIRESSSRRKDLFDRVASKSARGELLVRVGLQMIPILEQKVDCLDVMFGEDDLMDRTYEEGLPGNIASTVAGYVHCLAHSRTDLKVLEVGAGTGSATKVILDSLMPTARLDGGGLVSSVSTYHFTDISAAFFENAIQRFPDWAGILRPHVLNIEKDPAAQGFELGSYDLVIATHVLHATADLGVCLNNVKKLLRDGGDLILIENIKPELMCSPLGFGLLPGWWRSVEPYRQLNPLINEDEWHVELHNAGLQPRLLIKDTNDQVNEMSAFVAANVPSGLPTKCLFSLIYSSKYPGQYDLACKIADGMTSEARTIILVDLIDVSIHHTDTIGIILLGYQGLDLSKLSSAEFEKVQYILGSFTNLLWVSRDVDETPKSAMATGLVRTARWERDHDCINFLMLEIKQRPGDMQGVLSNITRVCDHAFTSEALVPRNAEYRLQDGILLINRLFPAPGINECIDSGSRSRSKLVELGHVPHPVKLTSVDPHQPNGFHFIEDEDYKRPLHPHEVQIEVRAVGIDEQDVEKFSRSIPGESLGWQGAGIVVGLGAAVQGLHIGDAVMALRTSSGTFQTFFRAHSAAVVKVPVGTSFAEAAALPVAFSTAYHCLANVARIQKEDKVLIHQASGGIGLAAVQIAQSLEATIYCTVSDDSQRQRILGMGIPSTQVFGTESWKTELCAVANSDKVDVILNLSPRGIESKDLNCFSSFGHLIDLHGQGIIGPVSASTSNRTYSIVDIRSMALQNPRAIQDTLRSLATLLAQQKVRPLSPTKFGFFGLSNVLSEIRQGIPGPWVLEPRPTDLIPVAIKPLGGHTFDPNASYVLVGGFGGIGRSVARWMVTRGAKNFIFVSRSGASSDPAKQLYTELLASGCGVSDLCCDITNKEAVVKAISSCQTTMPPIKGCMQCSMVLEDSMLSNMTHTQFLSAITPKVQGTINLASALSSTPLDFLIFLSSSAGIIGNRGQANYSAANAFLDAFAASLVQNGYPATSISLGSVLSVGWVAENQDRLPIALSYGAIPESLLLSILEYHMDPRWCAAQSPDTCHTVAGIRSAKDFHRQSIPLPGFMAYPLFSPLRAIANSSGAEKEEVEVPVTQALRSARSTPAAVEVVTRAIVMKLARVMAIPAKEIDPARTLASYGVDSLVTVDLKAWFKRDVGVNITSADLLGDVSMQGLAEKVAGTSELLSLRE